MPVIGVSPLFSFNPTLVRLRLPAVQTEPYRLGYKFQSHAGSIEAAGPASPASCEQQRFNPTLVRLRRRMVRRKFSASGVSIPRWFD